MTSLFVVRSIERAPDIRAIPGCGGWCSSPVGNLTILRQTRRMGEFEFEGPVVEWRGPAPFYFVSIPEADSADLKIAAAGVEYWGQVPVIVGIGDVTFTTALFPKDGVYLLPLKDAVRKDAGIQLGDLVAVRLSVGRRPAVS
jgi:hypothetical protein